MSHAGAGATWRGGEVEVSAGGDIAHDGKEQWVRENEKQMEVQVQAQHRSVGERGEEPHLPQGQGGVEEKCVPV